jgi:hypothetical protein
LASKQACPHTAANALSAKKPRSQGGTLANSREMFARIDEAGREAWIQLLDQGIATLGEAARRDPAAFLQVVSAPKQASYRGDATICALAGWEKETKVRRPLKEERSE